ncbi:MAG: 1-acyl-sn-glycerol-3-phosphate acyltransferase [Sulfurovum sp.]|nr:1-acyl-sn-glycerol-3-phosphate acyltransferase [Sulfurovum sp.]
MNLGVIKHLFYGLYFTNGFGFKLKKTNDSQEKLRLRQTYARSQLSVLNITVAIENPEKIPKEGQYLLACNHRSIIDPPIIEIALEGTGIFGLWISKKELYNSLFFGLFVRNAGSVLLDREKSQMSGFFADIKKGVSDGSSVFIFPEGTRNKTDKPIGEFKEGSRIIALKNRLPILPVFIKTDAGKVLKSAIKDDKTPREIKVVFGDILDYKSRDSLEERYRDMFSLND